MRLITTFRGAKPLISVVICSIDPDKFRKVTENYRRLLDALTIEIIGIHDACSLAEGYNRGIARARGRYLILSHDDIAILTPDFASRVLAHLQRFDIIGVAGTTQLQGGAWFLPGHPHNYQLTTSPHPETGELVICIEGGGDLIVPDAQALDGLFLAMRTAVARKLPFDQRLFDHFHLYDLDFTYRAHLAGYRLAICRDLFIIHYSHGTFDQTWSKYRLLFEEKFRSSLPRDPIRHARVFSNFVIADSILENPQSVAELCAPQSIAELIPTCQ